MNIEQINALPEERRAEIEKWITENEKASALPWPLFKPKIWQKYYTRRSTTGGVIECAWNNDAIDNDRWRRGNVFPAREAAESSDFDLKIIAWVNLLRWVAANDAAADMTDDETSKDYPYINSLGNAEWDSVMHIRRSPLPHVKNGFADRYITECADDIRRLLS